MSALVERDIEYTHGDVTLRGLLLTPGDVTSAPTVLLVPDAFGLGGFSLDQARRVARLGYVVFGVDMWGERRVVADPDDIGPLIASMVDDRERWIERIARGLRRAAELPEVDASRIAVVGYCFGGSTALELTRTGGAVRGIVGIHSGLDLLDPAARWTAASSGLRVLLCTGADDPMATAPQRSALEDSLTRAGIGWETDLYSHTVHAFTNPHPDPSPRPDVFAHNPRSAARAWDRTTRFLAEVLDTSREHEEEHA